MINLYLPYEKGISEQIAKFSTKYNVKVIHTKGKSLKNVLRQKQIENIDEQNRSQGTVYKVTCNDCDKFYIGETGRKLNIRLNEHKRDAKNKTGNMSGLSQHITNYQHTADWENVKNLHKDTNFIKRKFKEALAINENLNNVLNKKEEVKAISNIWENLI